MVEEILRAFPDASVHGGYVRIRCPYHKDGHERKPSMSILLENRGNAPAGLCHCFACGKKVMIDELFKDIGLDIKVNRQKLQPATSRNVKLNTTTPVYKPAMPFKVSSYLLSRGISEDVQRKFKVYEKDNKVYMPVFDREGLYLYANARSVKDKHFYVESGAIKTLWGIEEIDMSKPIAVCESQIDAMSLWTAGVQAVATLGADNISALSAIKKATGKIILAFDPDEAGIRARDRAVNMLGSFRCTWLDLPRGIDVNQALQDIKDIKKYREFLLKCQRSFVQ